MNSHVIETFQDFTDLEKYALDNAYTDATVTLTNNVYTLQFESFEQFNIPLKLFSNFDQTLIKTWVSKFRSTECIIFGKDETKNIVSCEVTENSIELFIEEDGKITSKFIENKDWIVSNRKFDSRWKSLSGDLFYKYIKFYDNKKFYYLDKKKHKEEIFSVSDPKESAMILNGFTYFKGMKVADVSTLFFDIESTGLTHNESSKVLLISNTYVNKGVITRKLFAYDEYENDSSMLDSWCSWVKEVNPSIVAGHNIFGYDLPYMNFCAKKSGTSLSLGRDGSDIKFNKYTSKFRKDGSQDYDYTRCYIYGREIVDTMFLAYHFDFSRKYENYGLKQIIKQEGLEVKDRVFYDASQIHKNYTNPEEWKKIKEYAIHDADDAKSLYDLMIPAYFYLTPSIPKSFQAINYTASGSQINSLLIRSYLQTGHSLPKASPPKGFTGAISMGNPGIYSNCWKVDVASLYPSIMLEYNVYDAEKDPNANFSKMVQYFTKERLENKKKAKETGDRYYKELQEAEKIIINSSYGLLGTPGLLFNSPSNAAMVTSHGRDILNKSISWAEANEFKLVNADTDSISITKNDSRFIPEEERQILLENLNSIYPKMIRFEDDGYFNKIIILKAKNYILYDGKKIKIKGSGLKSSKTEKGLKEFSSEIIEKLVYDKQDELYNVYNRYVREVFNLKDIGRWSSKKTITDAVLNPKRTTEEKILAALNGRTAQMGDKYHMYFAEGKALKLAEDWQADHDKVVLLSKLYKTLVIFKNVLDVKVFPKYHLKNKKVKAKLEEALNEL